MGAIETGGRRGHRRQPGEGRAGQGEARAGRLVRRPGDEGDRRQSEPASRQRSAQDEARDRVASSAMPNPGNARSFVMAGMPGMTESCRGGWSMTTRSASMTMADPKSSNGRRSRSASPAPARCGSGRRRSGSIISTSMSRTGLLSATVASRSSPAWKGAGVVTAVGEGVNDLKVGRRVAYAGPIGAYAQERLIAADRVVKLPAGISDETAAADHAQRHDRAISPAPDLQSRAGDDAAVPCGGGRRRADRLPMGGLARRHGDRHGRLGGQGADRPRAWLHPCHQLSARRTSSPR